MGVLAELTILATLLTVVAGYVFRFPVMHPLIPVTHVFPPMPNDLRRPRLSSVKVESTNLVMGRGGLPGNMGQGFPGFPEISLPAGLVMAAGGNMDGSTDFPVFVAPNIEWIWPKGERTGLPSIMNSGDVATKSSAASSRTGVAGGAGAVGVVFGAPV